MAADGKVKFNSRMCGYHHMGIDDYLYRYTEADARAEEVWLQRKQECRARLEVPEPRRLNKSIGFIANESLKNMGAFTHPKYGRGKLVSWTAEKRLVEFPVYGAIEI